MHAFRQTLNTSVVEQAVVAILNNFDGAAAGSSYHRKACRHRLRNHPTEGFMYGTGGFDEAYVSTLANRSHLFNKRFVTWLPSAFEDGGRAGPSLAELFRLHGYARPCAAFGPGDRASDRS